MPCWYSGEQLIFGRLSASTRYQGKNVFMTRINLGMNIFYSDQPRKSLPLLVKLSSYLNKYINEHVYHTILYDKHAHLY